MQLKQALNVQRGEMVAFVGAGGKTSALFRLGAELAADGWRVVGTTTTRIAASELLNAPGVLAIGNSLRPEAISRALNEHNFIFLYSHIAGDKAIGLSAEAISTLADAVDSDVTLIEADGARRLPFKAPYLHEPVIPIGTSLVVPTVGLDVLGQPLDDEHVYNSAAMIDQFGYVPGERVKAPWVASVLRDEELGLKGIPDSARVLPLINKVPRNGYQRGRARLIAWLTLRSTRIQGVALGAMQAADPVYEVRQRVAAIVLAGGLSSRMGEFKVLLPWDNRPVLNTILERLRNARLDETVVVTGHHGDRVRAAIVKEGVRHAHNADYKEGDMLSSLQTGIRALSPEIAACLIVLGDQPQIDTRVINDVLAAYAEGRGPIVAPSYRQRRGHPILIDRMYWPELLDLPRGGAPRDVINAHADEIAYVNVDNDSILRDIDTPDDYLRERRLAGLA